MDVGMLRKDYEIFIRVVEKEMGDKYQIMTPEIDKNYACCVTKFQRKGTKFVSYLSDDEITKLINMQLEDGSSWSIKSISVNGSDAMDYVYSYKKTKLYVMKPDEETVLNAKNNMKKVLENK